MASRYTSTSGFAYPSWKPAFYPPKLAAKDFLQFDAAPAGINQISQAEQMVQENGGK
jgi:hypothetical protein